MAQLDVDYGIDYEPFKVKVSEVTESTENLVTFFVLKEVFGNNLNMHLCTTQRNFLNAGLRYRRHTLTKKM